MVIPIIILFLQAISLSLQGSDVKNANVTGRKGNPQIQEDIGRRKRKNSVCYLKQSCFTFLLLFLSWLPICQFSLFVFHSLLVGSKWQRMSWFCTSFSLMVSYVISVLEGWAKLRSITHEVDSFKERQWVVAHLPFMFSNVKCLHEHNLTAWVKQYQQKHIESIEERHIWS